MRLVARSRAYEGRKEKSRGSQQVSTERERERENEVVVGILVIRFSVT